MRSTLRKQPARDTYFQLVQAFPLRPIRSAAEFDEAMRVLERLVVREDLDAGESDYAQVLTSLVEKYESQQASLHRAEPVAVLKHLMRVRRMSIADLGRVLGHSSLASAILSGKRQISKTHARALANHFGLEVGAFII